MNFVSKSFFLNKLNFESINYKHEGNFNIRNKITLYSVD